MSSYSIHQEWRFAPSDRVTWAVQRLILLNSAVFAVQLVLDVPFGEAVRNSHLLVRPGGLITNTLAFEPTSLVSMALWKPFTYMFLHGSLMHLFFNMLWLFFFGPEVERALGTRQFIRFYVICGTLSVLASFFSLVFGGQDPSITGASGAVMAVMVAFAMLNPDRQVFLFPLPIPINMRWMVIMILGFNLLSAFQGGGNVSVATHLGGMGAGYLYMTIVPKIRRRLWRQNQPQHSPMDRLGKAVDNIFDFSEKHRRGK
jgi:membrane associated rhomboid family serine protease